MKKIVAGMAVIAALVLVGSGQWPFPNFGTTGSGTPVSITIGEFPYETSALIYIAEDQGYFAANGLNVTMRDYTSSPSAIDGLLDNETDMAVASEFNLVGAAFKRENIGVIGIVDKYQMVDIIARRDKGIGNISDLKGKRIGLTRKSQLEFYLGRFLNLHGVSLQDITLVDLLPAQYVQAITNGSVDAIIAGNKHIDQIQELLGSNVVVWPAQNSQPGYYLIACRGDWVADHPEQINRLLKSIARAEDYTIEHPDKSKVIVQKKLNYSEAYMSAAWHLHQFSLALDQSLLIVMNDEAYWMIRNNLTTVKTLPYFRDCIYTKGLLEVNPEAVNIR